MARKYDSQANNVAKDAADQKEQTLRLLVRKGGEGRSANEVYNMSAAELRAAADADGVFDRGQLVDAYGLTTGADDDQAANETAGRTDSQVWETTWDEMYKRGVWAQTGHHDEEYDGGDTDLETFVSHREAEIWRIQRDNVEGWLTTADPAAGRLYDPADLTDEQIRERLGDLARHAEANDGSLAAPFTGPRSPQQYMNPFAPSDPPTPPKDGPSGDGPPAGGDPPAGPGDPPTGGQPPGVAPGGNDPPAGSDPPDGGGGPTGGSDGPGSSDGSSDGSNDTGGPPPGSTRYSHAVIPGVAAEQGYRDANGKWYNEDGTPMDTAKAERMEKAYQDGDTQQLDTVPDDDANAGDDSSGDDNDDDDDNPDVDRSEDPTGDNYRPDADDLERAQDWYDLIRAGRDPIDPAPHDDGEPTGDPLWPVRPGVDQPGPFGEERGREPVGAVGFAGADPRHTDPVPGSDFGAGGKGPYLDKEIAQTIAGEPDLTNLNVPGASPPGETEPPPEPKKEDEEEEEEEETTLLEGTSGFAFVQQPFDPTPPPPRERDDDEFSKWTFDADEDESFGKHIDDDPDPFG